MPKLELPQPENDGYLIPVVGEHSRSKHYYLSHYMQAFSIAMQRKRWSSLHYVDLFAGVGIVELEDSKELSWGSPLIAAQIEPKIDQIHACEADPRKFEALSFRLGRLAHKENPQLLCGDANIVVSEIVSAIPPRSLTLAFLDPYGLHLFYETVRSLSKRHCDLIIYFPDRVDVLRNWRMNYDEDRESNLDRVLGTGDWRLIFESEAKGNWVKALRDLYITQLGKLGYTTFRFIRIEAAGRPIYQLIFCSKADVAAKIWDGISKIQPDRQRLLLPD